jgi:hypothetical protein
MVRIDRGRFTTVNLRFAEPIAAPFGDNYFACNGPAAIGPRLPGQVAGP